MYMNGAFNSDNPFMRLLTNFFNLMFVNLLFIFTSIPVITIGPSLCGLYKVCLCIVSGEDTEVFKTYFKEFKSSFWKGLGMWLIVLSTSAFFIYELNIIYFHEDLLSGDISFLQYPIWLMLLIVIQIFLYGFALLASFENSLKKTMINCLLLSIKNFPTTIMLVVIWLFSAFLFANIPDWQYMLIGFELFFNFALRAYLCSIFLHKAFGLKKIRYRKDGSEYEESWEEEDEDPDHESDGDEEDSEDGEDASEDDDTDESDDDDDGSEEDISDEDDQPDPEDDEDIETDTKKESADD